MSVYSPEGSIINPEMAIHFSFDIANGGVVLVEQDSDMDVENRIWIVLSYEPGMLVHAPDFGVPDQAFTKGGANLDVIERAILNWVPEANELIESDPNWFQTLTETIHIRRDESSGA